VRSNRTVLIWDSVEPVPEGEEIKVLWQSYTVANPDLHVSIPQIVEDHAAELKARYLALIYELGELNIKGSRVVECLEIRPGFSYWWMTLLSEKCNFAKSPQINNIIKFLAFIKWLESNSEINIVLIKIVTDNIELSQAIRLLAINRVVKYEYVLTSTVFKINFFNKFYYDLPYVFQSLLYLIHYIFLNWKLIGVGEKELLESTAKTTFVSYLFNFDINKAIHGTFSSHYWADLPNILALNKKQCNWIHIYIKSDYTSNVHKAIDIINSLNKNNRDSQCHILLESFFNVKCIINTLKDLIKLYLVRHNIQKHIKRKCGPLWPLLKKDFIDSLIGRTSIKNLLSLHLFDQAMRSLPKQEKGVYLQENQGWEYGFIHAWNSNGHRGLIGTPHSTVRYWDLRYFHDYRIYNRKNNCVMPLPDLVGINGQSAKNMYLDGGYPKNRLVDVEALRYKHLSDLPIKDKNDINVVNNGELTVLVLGDYLRKNTRRQMRELNLASTHINHKVKYLVKSHPYYTVVREDYPDLNITITNKNISSLVDECDLAYSSPITSAAVDAYCLGLPVLTILDPSELNMSPLRNYPNVTFVCSHQELSDVINNFRFDNVAKFKDINYFFYDSQLNRWNNILYFED